MRKPLLPAIVLLLATLALAACDDEDTTTPTTPTNHAPVITSIESDPQTVGIGVASSVTCLATDADGDALTYAWSSTAGTVAGTGATITWTAPDEAGS